jgi:hypothetical protein
MDKIIDTGKIIAKKHEGIECLNKYIRQWMSLKGYSYFQCEITTRGENGCLVADITVFEENYDGIGRNYK